MEGKVEKLKKRKYIIIIGAIIIVLAIVLTWNIAANRKKNTNSFELTALKNFFLVQENEYLFDWEEIESKIQLKVENSQDIAVEYSCVVLYQDRKNEELANIKPEALKLSSDETYRIMAILIPDSDEDIKELSCPIYCIVGCSDGSSYCDLHDTITGDLLVTEDEEAVNEKFAQVFNFGDLVEHFVQKSYYRYVDEQHKIVIPANNRYQYEDFEGKDSIKEDVKVKTVAYLEEYMDLFKSENKDFFADYPEEYHIYIYDFEKRGNNEIIITIFLENSKGEFFQELFYNHEPSTGYSEIIANSHFATTKESDFEYVKEWGIQLQ